MKQTQTVYETHYSFQQNTENILTVFLTYHRTPAQIYYLALKELTKVLKSFSLK